MSTALLALYLLTAVQQTENDEPQPAKRPLWANPAPALQIAAWIPRKPPALPGPAIEGKESLFVVHFWSLREPATQAALPRLRHLSKRHAGRSVQFLCISNDDTELVAAFASRNGIELTLGTDDDNLTSEAWLGNEPAFPFSFLVDASGKIIWLGGSIVELGDRLNDALEGRWSIVDARKRAEAEPRIAEHMQDVDAALAQGDPKVVLRLCDRIIAIDPSRIESYALRRRLALRMGAMAEVAAGDDVIRTALWNSVAGLDMLLDAHWSQRSLAGRNPALMLRLAQRMAELTHHDDPFVLHSLARTLHEVGRVPEATRVMTSAMEKLPQGTDGEFAVRLTYLRAICAMDAAADGAASAPASRSAASRPSVNEQ